MQLASETTTSSMHAKHGRAKLRMLLKTPKMTTTSTTMLLKMKI